MQGRLQGKRLDAQYFVDDVVEHATEGCNYLLAVDVEMNTVEGYEISSGRAATATSSWCRTVHAAVGRRGSARHRAVLLADAQLAGPARPSPSRPGRSCSARSAVSAERGWTACVGTELEFIVFQDSFEQAWNRRYIDLTPANQYNSDYSILGTSRIEPLLRARPARDARGGDAGRVGQGRVQPRPARDRVQVRRARSRRATTT